MVVSPQPASNMAVAPPLRSEWVPYLELSPTTWIAACFITRSISFAENATQSTAHSSVVGGWPLPSLRRAQAALTGHSHFVLAFVNVRVVELPIWSALLPRNDDDDDDDDVNPLVTNVVSYDIII
jgi:hypothetical protein